MAARPMPGVALDAGDAAAAPPPGAERCAGRAAEAASRPAASLDALAARALVWRGDALAAAPLPGIPTGFAALDAAIPGGGWPVGALSEVLAAEEGIGELSLFLPAAARLTRADRWLALVAPPHLPYAPALAAAGLSLGRLLVVQPAGHAETLWSLRQAVSSGACALVLGWPGAVATQALRRLQLAAEGSDCALVLCRPARFAREASPAVLKLQLEAEPGRLMARILKRRGAHLAEPLPLDIPRPLPRHALACTASAQPAAAGLPACCA